MGNDTAPYNISKKSPNRAIYTTSDDEDSKVFHLRRRITRKE
jgi:hypothetical protein